MHTKSITQSILLFGPLLLTGLGIIMIYSASSIFADYKFQDGGYFMKKQFVFAVFGTLCMLLVMRIPYDVLRRLAYPLWIISLGLLIGVLLPGIGTEIGGAVRWLRIGPLSFQPAEFAKLAVIILLASSLSKKGRDKIKNFSIGVVPHLLLVLPLCILILVQPDFGTAAMITTLLFGMMFIGGVRLRYLFGLFAAALCACAPLILFKGYRMERMLTFLDPWEKSTGSGFQIIQSFLAFGAGGLRGTGLGRGTQKLFYLPEPHTDFILAVIGEEFGFVGVMAVIIVFVAIIICGLKVARHAQDLFGAYVALGIVLLLGVQTIINMGVVLGLLPTKGMPLPFVSYGGTSLVMNLMAVGVLLSVSSQADFKSK
jgi:cell division protein FtsW